MGDTVGAVGRSPGHVGPPVVDRLGVVDAPLSDGTAQMARSAAARAR
jgi:hypothetical protein